MRNNRRHPSFLLRYTAIIVLMLMEECQLELIAGLSLRLGTESKTKLCFISKVGSISVLVLVVTLPSCSVLVGTPMCMQSLCAIMVPKAARRPGVCWVCLDA